MEENQGDVSSLSMVDDTLSSQAQEEFGETDELREECIQSIREWLKTEEKCYPLGILF